MTTRISYNTFEKIISTHTLTWSVTRTLFVETEQIVISTHTLTWSVTGATVEFTIIILNFNSHAHVERDNLMTALDVDLSNFNSHAHVERDDLDKLRRINMNISTHTLTWSVTQKNICRTLIKSFQLTRSRGA